MPPVENKTIVKRRARVLKIRSNVRKTLPPEADLRALARSVMKRQIHPFIILPEDIILDGHLRQQGLMLEDPEFEVDAIVVERELGVGEVEELQLISALHSTTLTPYCQALACKEWLEKNLEATAKVLAEKIDRDPSQLTKLLSLWKTIPQVVTAAEQGRISVKAWYPISLLPEADQLGMLELHLSGTSAGAIVELGRKKRQAATTTAPTVRVSRIKCQVPGKGVTVVVSGEAIDLSDMLEALTELLKEGKKANERGLDAKTFEKVCRDLSNKE